MLLGLAALVQAYLLYMLLAIWLATFLRRCLQDRDGAWLAALLQPIAIAATLLATLWMAGYFMLPEETIKANAEIYGVYAADLNAYFNPHWGSRFLPNLKARLRKLQLPGVRIAAFDRRGCGFLAMLPPAGRGTFSHFRGGVAVAIAISSQVRLNEPIVSVHVAQRCGAALFRGRAVAQLRACG